MCVLRLCLWLFAEQARDSGDQMAIEKPKIKLVDPTTGVEPVDRVVHKAWQNQTPVDPIRRRCC